MELYNNIIKNTYDLLAPYTPIKLDLADSVNWPVGAKNELILAKDTAFELGGSFLPAVNYSCATSSETLVNKNEILLYGNDIQSIKNDVPFARLVFLQTDDIIDEDAYKSIKELEFVKYDINLKGYMVRVSALDRREQVRISKKALSDGINFSEVGNQFILKFLQHKLVKAVKVVFITSELPIFNELISNARKIDDITNTLNHVLNSMNFDCQNCNLKPICDEVQGMRELHFKNAKKRKF